MKSFIKLDDDITDWKNKRKIQELSEICRTIIEKGDDGIHLNKINYITDTFGWKEAEKILNADILKTKRKYHTNEFQFL